MKKMLINATHPEEVRTALVDGQKLYDFNIESETNKQRKSNIYKGLIVQVSASLEAAFVDYGAERHGFLPYREIVPEFLGSDGVPRQGQELVLQVDKEERGNKGASLTTYPSLPGRFLVLMPNNPKVGGISRLVDKEEERRVALDSLSQLQLPQGMGLIMRTAGIGRSPEELQHDLDYLMQLWESIRQASEENKAPVLVYEDSDTAVRILRDYLRNDVSEVLIDNEEFYNRAQQFMQKLLPGEVERIRLYSEPDPLFVRYQVESQIETAYSRTVSLPSGGQMVFDSTEALLSIDINSARNTGGSDIEATAFHTNMEAAAEIPRQLRLRDIGGLIVIDFIDMVSNGNQRKVEDCLRDNVRVDRARIQIGRISKFGLLEMSRQRLRRSLSEAHLESCPKCRGIGYLRTVSSQANAILRLIEEESFKDATAKILVRLPVDVSSVLINDKKEVLQEIEKHTGVRVMVFPSKNLDHPDYQIRRIRSSAEEDSDDVEQEFHNSAPRASSDESFLSHSQNAKQQSVSPKAAVKYNDIPIPASRPVGVAADGSDDEGGNTIGKMRSLFGWFAGKGESQADELPASGTRDDRSANPYGSSANEAGAHSGANSGARKRGSRGGNRGRRNYYKKRGPGNPQERERGSSNEANMDGRRGSRSSAGGPGGTGGGSADSEQRPRRRRQYSYRGNGNSGDSSGGNAGTRAPRGRYANRDSNRDTNRDSNRDANRDTNRGGGNQGNRQMSERPDSPGNIPDDIGNRR